VAAPPPVAWQIKRKMLSGDEGRPPAACLATRPVMLHGCTGTNEIVLPGFRGATFVARGPVAVLKYFAAGREPDAILGCEWRRSCVASNPARAGRVVGFRTRLQARLAASIQDCQALLVAGVGR
jgi:hypothetical protein